MWQIRVKSQNGSFLIGALVLASILGVAVLATTTLVVTQGQEQQIFVNERKAFYAAETGIEYALGVLGDSSDWRGGVARDSVGDGEFSVALEDETTIPSLGDTVLVTATGFKGNVQRSIQVYVIPPGAGSDDGIDYVILAGNDIDFSSGKAVINGDLHSNNAAKIGKKYTINGKVTSAPPNVELPTVNWDFLKKKASDDGNYVVGDIEFKKSDSPYNGAYYATGKAIIKDNNVVINGSIIAEDDIELIKNNENITARNNLPAIVTKNNLIVQKNGANISGLIYCKNLDINKNNLVIDGAIIVTNTIKNQKNNAKINFKPIKVAGITFPSSKDSSDSPQVAKWRISK